MAFNENQTTTHLIANVLGPESLATAPKPFKPDERLKRRISRRTGGAVTPEGRARASQNSTKHGGYADQPRLTEDFVVFERQLHEALVPVGFVQGQLATRIAFAMWRSQKIQRYTQELIDTIGLNEVQLGQLAKLVEFPFDATYLPLLSLPVNYLELQRKLEGFWRGALACGVGGASADVSAGDDRLRAIHKEGLDTFALMGMHPVRHAGFFDAMDRVMLDARNAANSPGLRLREVGSQEPLVDYWIFRNGEKVSAMRRQIVVTEVMRILCDPNIERAQRSADRDLTKLLQTYRQLKGANLATGCETDLYKRVSATSSEPMMQLS